MRHSLSAGLRMTPLFHRGALTYLAAYLKYCFYFDDWGIRAHTPEVRAYIGLGPTELRLTGRYYFQTAADFFRGRDYNDPTDPTKYVENDKSGIAEYPGNGERTGATTKPGSTTAEPWAAHCPAGGCYTGDAKLSQFTSVFVEGRFSLSLNFLDRPSMPLGRWLGGGLVAVSVGYYWNDGFANAQFGNAYVGGFELVLPL
jgi:hypothetical protein